MRRKFDLLVIGGGSAGFNAARVSAQLGKRVAVVDGARQLGGLCILRGCMPSKTLIYSAEVLHLAKEGSSFGVNIPSATADVPSMHARKLKIIREFAGYRVKQLKAGRFELIRGTARFVDAHTVEIDGKERIAASKILIATGSKAAVPDIPGLSGSKFWTSDDVLNLSFRPRSVIVLGGGFVACELAQFLGRIGTKVCVIQRSPSLLKDHSPEAGDVITRAFRDQGIEVLTGTKVTAVRTSGATATVTFRKGSKTFRRRAAHLVNAMGREPDVSALDLGKAGVETAANGRIKANRWQQTTSPNIYAAGDCCGPHEIVHIAIQQGELAARHAAGLKGIRPIDRSLLMSVVFTDPQVATIGWSAKDLHERGMRFVSSSYPFDDHGKSILMNATRGFVRVHADPDSGRILGAEIVGKDAGELIHCFSTPLAMRATVSDMLKGPWYHPTLSEIITYPLEDISERIGPSGGRRREAKRRG